MDGDTRLTVDDLTLEVPAGGGSARRLLDGISFDIDAGQIFTILGPSGSGKSSLLRCLNRLAEPTGGDVALDGVDVATIPVRELRRRVGMVFQHPTLFPGTIADNVLYGPRARDALPTDQVDFARRQLDLVGLPPDWAGHPVDDLSGGEIQRVALARALANEPDVLLLDEPTAALDQSAGARVERLLLDLASRTRLTFVWVTHDLDQARRIGDAGLVLVDGRVVEQGSLGQLLAEPAEELTRLFVAGELTTGELSWTLTRETAAGSGGTGSADGGAEGPVHGAGESLENDDQDMREARREADDERV
jgi:putative ABC transport system ATP-binding protein